MKKTLFFLAAALLIFGCPAVSPLDENTKLNESNFMYEALSGNRPVPPADITVTTVMTDEGAVPVVSWVPDEKAVQYNIYRKKAGEEKNIGGAKYIVKSLDFDKGEAIVQVIPSSEEIKPQTMKLSDKGTEPVK